MEAAFGVVCSWGFTCRTILTWCKPKIGTGEWLRGQTEHCLLCTRGRAVVRLTCQSTGLHAPTGKHSEKPQRFYELVESLCPGSKVELFARRRRPGWAAHGLELPPQDAEADAAAQANGQAASNGTANGHAAGGPRRKSKPTRPAPTSRPARS